jgi:hypothetical protein
MASFVCCYCKEEVVGFGNNPYDYSEDFYKKYKKKDMCCDKCYNTVVTPKKMLNMGVDKNAFKK